MSQAGTFLENVTMFTQRVTSHKPRHLAHTQTLNSCPYLPAGSRFMAVTEERLPRLPEETEHNMLHYASSAPATDKPYQELDDFPSVAAISERVKMNPLTPSFSPALPQQFIFTPLGADNFSSEDGHDGPLPQNTSEQHVGDLFQELQSLEFDENATSIFDHGFNQTNMVFDPETALAADPSNVLEATTTPSEYQEANIQQPHSTHFPVVADGHNENTMSRRLLTSELPTYQSAPPTHIDLNYHYHPQYQYEQNAMRSHPPPTPSLSVVLPDQPYAYYWTQLYGRPLPVISYHSCPPPFYQLLPPHHGIGPLPPSYPFPHLTPPGGPRQTQRRFPLPYDNTAKATAYLQAFTTLYGTSPTSVPALQALCLTLGHPNSEARPLPKTIRKAQNFLKARFVNIFDLVDYGMRGEAVPAELIFATAGQLRRYSEDTKKICPASVGRIEGDDHAGNELWRWMLRKWY